MTYGNKGSISAPLLVVSATLIVVIYGLVFLLSNQVETTFRQTAYDQALYVAEAGIQYYRWHLAHAPNDYTDGTGNPGPYVHTYKDAQGKELGQYSLVITPPSDGSSIITITSTGWLNEYEGAKRTIVAKYGIPSLTKYAHLSNASAWYGEGIIINGPIHSNTGIRMDGINNSIVSSAQATYQCGNDTGCTPTQRKNGVWGIGPNYYLWKFPVPQADFDSILFDFGGMKDAATNKGLYLAPIKNGGYGYHLVFDQNGTVTVTKVTRLERNFHAYDVNAGCNTWDGQITQEVAFGTYQVMNVPIIFSENNLWVEGVVNGKITVVAATFPLQSTRTDIWVPNNLTYKAKDGKHAIGLVAQDNVIFGRDVPNNFEVDGALMAQNGKVMRHGFNMCSNDTTPNAVRNSLTIFGSVLTNQKSYWNYGDAPTSGFRTRTLTYDPNLMYAPPPYFPSDGDYEFISWQEE